MIRMPSTVRNSVITGNEVSITLPNGLTLKGHPAQVASTALQLGYAVPMYKSSTEGNIPIMGMVTRHLRNALVKKLGTWVTSLKDMTDIELAEELRGLTPSEHELRNLISEYVTREGVTRAS